MERQLKLNFFGRSDTGRVRSANQDNFYAKRLCTNSALCVVCDGMGGARGGNVASSLAAEAFAERLSKLVAAKTSNGVLKLTPESACRMLDDAADAANLAVYKKSQSAKEYSGMGTTLVAVLFCGDVAYAVNIGDSRLYLISGGELTQITHDHSYVQHLVDSGEITPEEARNHPFRNRITRAVGIGSSIESDIFSIDLHGIEECRLLLCSDGLHGMLAPEEIRAIICEDEHSGIEPEDDEITLIPIGRDDGDITAELERITRSLIDAANQAGGSDNITAVLMQYAAEL